MNSKTEFPERRLAAGRDFFLFSIPALFCALAVVMGLILWHQHTNFERVYLKQQQKEIGNSIALMRRYFQPLLDANDLAALDLLCETYAFDERSIAILDRKGNAISASPNADLRGIILDRPEFKRASQNGSGAAVRRDSRSGIWTLYEVAAIRSRGHDSYIYISLPTRNISNVLNETSKIVFFALLLSAVVIAVFSWYLFYDISRPLTALQRSAERIAGGEPSAEIQVPRRGVMRSLAQSMSKMALQLQKEIRNAKKQESFRRDFIANVSHEIKTPLTGILSAAELLQERSGSDEERRKCLEILSLQAARLNRLVRDILNLSRLEKTEFEETVFRDLCAFEMIEKAIRLCADAAAQKSCRLGVEGDRSLLVRGNPELLEQALLNLITNAIQYSGGSEITISATSTYDSVFLTVRDDGNGIPPEAAEKVFERFYRIPREYGAGQDGTGLGLAIVKQIAALHGGTVAVLPPKEKGAEFQIRLPRICRES